MDEHWKSLENRRAALVFGHGILDDIVDYETNASAAGRWFGRAVSLFD
ncbi:MAG: hypothetical protein QNK18_17790 [Gammaproteobacteria bacterium]|nr:hypothetical protein [Gammaproteobacteria bacterium]